MSTYWGYYCQTCQMESDQWFNHGETRLRDLAVIAPLLAQLAHSDAMETGLLSMTVGSQLRGDIVTWLVTHQGHVVELCNEYGDHEPLDSADPSRGYTLYIQITGAQRAEIQHRAGLEALPYSYQIRNLLQPHIQAMIGEIIAKIGPVPT